MQVILGVKLQHAIAVNGAAKNMRAVGNFYIAQRQTRCIVKIFSLIMQAKNCQGAIVLQVHIAPFEA